MKPKIDIKITIVNASHEVESMVNDVSYGPDWSESVAISVNYGRCNKKVAEITKLSKNVIILNFNIYFLRFMLARPAGFWTILLE